MFKFHQICKNMQRAFREWEFLLIFIASFSNGLHSASIAQDIDGDIADVETDVDKGKADARLGIKSVVPDCILGPDNVDYLLYNRENPDGVLVNLTSDHIPVQKNISTVFLVHGFISEANTSQYQNLTHALVDKNDVNVFAVDWAEGACSVGGIPLMSLVGYPSAAKNTMKVGADMSKFIGRLIKNYGIHLSDIEFIGHSLGAHVVGFAGKNLQKQGIGTVRNILALDPAGPTFEHNPCSTRLCSTDAEFLQVFHTSFAFGTHKPIGEVDFYFNGGENQPSCPLIERLVCSHSSAIIYLIEIVLDPKCNYVGKKWDRSWSDIPDFTCSEDTCSVPGPLAAQLPARGSFYIDTKDVPSTCDARLW